MVIRRKSMFRNYIRQLLGDPDKQLFLDDELDGYIERYTDAQLMTGTVTCYSLKYKLNVSCGAGYPVRDVNLVSGYDANGVYVIDEVGGAIYFDADDPLNTAANPADGTQIVISYWMVDVPCLMSELFFVLSSNHTKLATAQSVMGASIDTSKLATEFYNASVRWRAETCGQCH